MGRAHVGVTSHVGSAPSRVCSGRSGIDGDPFLIESWLRVCTRASPVIVVVLHR